MSRLAVLAGRTFSDLTRSAATLLLMLAVGVAIGVRWQTSLLVLIAGLAVALVFGYSLSWLMAFLGLVAQSAEAVQAAVHMVVFPLRFTSAVIVPTQTMPTWLQGFAEHQPVTVAANALRGLMLGDGALAPGADRGRPGRPLAGVGRRDRCRLCPLSVRAPTTGPEPECTPSARDERWGPDWPGPGRLRY